MHKTVIVTPAGSDPVTVSELQTHLNQNVTGSDTYLESLISACTTALERYLNRALITQTWKVFYDCWKTEMLIPFAPLQSVTHVKYYDTDGAQQTLSSSTDYWTVTSEDPGRIVRKYDVTYPELQLGRPDAIEIQFVAGYGNASSVPDDIKHGILLWATDLYEHRGTVVIGSVNKIPNYLIDLVHSYKLYHF